MDLVAIRCERYRQILRDMGVPEVEFSSLSFLELKRAVARGNNVRAIQSKQRKAERKKARQQQAAPKTETKTARQIEYAAYLRSAHWLEFRQKAIDWADNRCQLCNDNTPLQVHHRDYSRLGKERLNDVIALCVGCHRIFHDRIGKPKSERKPRQRGFYERKRLPDATVDEERLLDEVAELDAAFRRAVKS